jgi:tetratricopeptide (TPR) repeat protein
MMTGTRSSLIALAMLLLFLPMIIVRFKLHLVAAGRGWRKSLLTLAITIGVMGSLGTIPTGNSKVIAELGAISANERAFDRGASMATSKEYVSGSFSVRASMWVATLRMAQAHPLTGVGAGAWEVEIPLYQTNMRLTETDYYAHNEIVQLVAEYGLVGWIFLAVLLIYLAYASWLTWLGNDDINSKAALRAFALCSLLMLFVVGNAGFPWRTAGTGALFALSLSILAASDAKLYSAKIWLTRVRTPRPIATRIALLLAATCLAIAACISAIALRSERDLVRSLRISMMIGNSDDPLNRRWDTLKYQALQLAKEGISLNPHYRKLTPAIGDQFAQWGDLKTAIWIWESVLASRPHVLALLCNLSRAYMELGQLSVAKDYLERAQRLQQEVPEVRALEIELLLRSGQYKLAVNRFEILLRANLIDFRLALLTYKAAKQVQYTPLMVQALEWRIAHIPSEAGAAWLTLGKTLAQENGHELQALRAFRSALEAMPDRSNRQAILDQIPDFYRTQIEATENRP